MAEDTRTEFDFEIFDVPAGEQPVERYELTTEFIDDDASERAARKLSRYLEETEQHMGMLLELMPIGFALHQPQSIVFANEFLCGLLGIPENILIGRHCLDFIVTTDSGDSGIDLLMRFNDVFDNGTPINEPALTFEDAQGNLRTVQLIVGRMPWDGQPLAQVLMQDVSHIKKLERALHRRSQEIVSTLIRETEARKQQSEFISVISHEFRTPLTLIDGGAQLIDRMVELNKPEKIKAKTAKIREAAARMSGLIDETVAAVSLERTAFEIKPERLNLARTIMAHVDAFHETTPSHSIDCDLDALPETIIVDRKSCEHIFENLLSNAVKYSPEANCICVRGRQDDDGNAVVEVQDYGVGIPEKELPNMFRRYFRASTSNGIAGTGVGLNLVKSLLEMQGGSIALHSVLGEGTTLTLTLPPEPPAAPTEPARKES